MSGRVAPSLHAKDADEAYFQLNEAQNWRVFERGFLQIAGAIPTTDSLPTIPPSELYEHIEIAYDEHNPDRMLEALTDLSQYIFRNGFDDPDELDRTRVIAILFSLCEVRLSENAKLAPTAFHILSLLQAKGPSFPYAVMGNQFALFCLQFVEHSSPLMYYPLTCLSNYCAQGEKETYEIMESLPVSKLRSLFDTTFTDTFVREAVLDIGFRYAKHELAPDSALGLIGLAQTALVLKSSYYSHSACWILVRLLRHYQEAIPHIMMSDILGIVDNVLRCKRSYDVIPGLIFISYVYELGFSLPQLPASRLLKRLAESAEPTVQRQACRTLIKIVTRRPEFIPDLLKAGIFGEISFALERAKFRDKHEIGLLACFVIEFGGDVACERVFQTKCVNLWLELFEYEDDELSMAALAALDRIFLAGEEMDDEKAGRMHRRFVSTRGVETIQNLGMSENEEIANSARVFFETYLTEIGQVDEPAEEEDEEQLAEQEEGFGPTW
jgi:hypothetical protein